MGTVRRRSGVPRAPIDDRAPHIWIVITYEREWEQGRSLQVIARRGRQGRGGAGRRSEAGSEWRGSGDDRRRARLRSLAAAAREGTSLITYGGPGSAAWLWGSRACRRRP